jgi:hypothetical protein
MVRLPAGSTVPMPPSIDTLEAFEELQESVVGWPRSMVEGEALRLSLGAGLGGSGVGGGTSVLITAGGGVTFLAQPPDKSAAAASGTRTARTNHRCLLI